MSTPSAQRLYTLPCILHSTPVVLVVRWALSSTIFRDELLHDTHGTAPVPTTKHREMIEVMVPKFCISSLSAMHEVEEKGATHSSYRAIRSSHSSFGSALGTSFSYSLQNPLPKPPNMRMIPSSYSECPYTAEGSYTTSSIPP